MITTAKRTFEGKKVLTAKEVKAGRTYLKEYTNQMGINIKIGDKLVWDWNIKEGEIRKPKRVKAIFKDSNIVYYPETDDETVWIDLEDMGRSSFKTKNGKLAEIYLPLNVDGIFLNTSLNLRIVK